MPHGFVYTAHGIVNVRFPSVYSPLRYSGARGDPRFAGVRDDEAEIVAAYGSQSNEADIFTVAFTLLPPLRQEVTNELECLLSRMRQYCDIQLSASLRGWCIISLAEIDTVFSVDTVYLVSIDV
jgi:hypothetical protein